MKEEKERRFELEPEEAGDVIAAHVMRTFGLEGTYETFVDVQTRDGVPTLFIVRLRTVLGSKDVPEEPG